MITSKEHIIEYFKSGIKNEDNFKIGIEHEKFLFDLKKNKRIDYQTILKMFTSLYEFGWKPILEKKNKHSPLNGARWRMYTYLHEIRQNPQYITALGLAPSSSYILRVWTIFEKKNIHSPLIGARWRLYTFFFKICPNPQYLSAFLITPSFRYLFRVFIFFE